MEKNHVAMYRRLLESISLYSKKILAALEYGAGDLPQWTNDLISESRTHIADVTHFLRGEANEGIRYGQANHGRAYMATANLRQIHEYANECLSLMEKDAGHYPAWVENKVSITAEYMDLIGHWLENESAEGRQYGSYLNPVPGDAGDEALYRGRADGITNRHRNPYSPNDFRRKVYEQGFGEGRGGPSGSPRPIPASVDESAPATAALAPQQHPADLPGSPSVTYQSGYGSMMARGGAPTAPMMPGVMEHTMPPNRMLEPHRQGEQSRMLWHQTGRRFGTPPPGWIGAGGVAQIPHPNRGMRVAPDRSFGPGLSAGQGGVQTFEGGGGPMAVQTYGSLGYASMGDGSMDMAVRQGRRFSGLFCPKGHYLHCKAPFDCSCVKGARAWRFWEKRPSPLWPQGDSSSTPAKRSRYKRPATRRRRKRR